MTHAIRFTRTGGPDVMRWQPVDVAEPAPGEALVRHTAVGINFIDTYHRSGLYPLPSLPSGLGVEAAGVVEAVGNGVTEVSVGDRVAYAGGSVGAYAERRVFPAARLVRVPDEVDDLVAAAAMLKGMTVEYLIRRTYEVKPRDVVLLHAAAGGVGLIASQWLASLGATVIGTVSSDEKAELARAHGCHHPVVYTRESFVERVAELTGGEGVAVVYDGVGRSTFGGSLNCLRRRGLMVAFGNASGAPDPLDVLDLTRKGSLYVTRPTMADYTASRDDLLLSAGRVFDVIASGAVTIEINQRWPLAEAAEAHRALEARETTGSSVLLP